MSDCNSARLDYCATLNRGTTLPSLEVAPMPVAREGEPRKSIRCRLGFHDWFTKRDRSGEKYVVCKRCDKQDVIGPGDTGWQFGWGGG
jgi:hypothetical protein